MYPDPGKRRRLGDADVADKSGRRGILRFFTANMEDVSGRGKEVRLGGGLPYCDSDRKKDTGRGRGKYWSWE